MFGEWLALHQVLAGKLCYTFNYIHAHLIIYMLGTTNVNAVQVLGLWLLIHLKDYSSSYINCN